MTRYIDEDICIAKIKDMPVTYDAETVQRCIEIVSNAQTIDAELVRHGKWEMKSDPFGFFDEIPVCSECGCTTKMRDKPAYCPEEVVAFMVEVAMFLGGSSYYAFSSLTEFPFLFPFKYRVTKEQLMQDERFTLSTFDATLCVALK